MLYSQNLYISYPTPLSLPVQAKKPNQKPTTFRQWVLLNCELKELLSLQGSMDDPDPHTGYGSSDQTLSKYTLHHRIERGDREISPPPSRAEFA